MSERPADLSLTILSRTEGLTALHQRIEACRACHEAGYPLTPRPVLGQAVLSPLMLVGQAPGRTEAAERAPWMGPSGKRLWQWLARAGLEETQVRQRAYLTAVTRCYPGSGAHGDRPPSPAERALCRPFL
ncbi:MAG: uracil-DNA glycosylase, partial [Chloroflexota bacterium]